MGVGNKARVMEIVRRVSSQPGGAEYRRKRRLKGRDHYFQGMEVVSMEGSEELGH